MENEFKASIYAFLMKARPLKKNTFTKYTTDFVTFENVNYSFLHQ